ncbi:MAG: caspase family protein [Acidobacteriota bacterium]
MPIKLHVLAILCALLAMPAGAQQSRQDPKTWAVVIGISKYQKLPGGQQLQFADRDAISFAEALEKRGVSAQTLKLLTGSEATAAAIKSAIGNWLARSVSESDTVLIFFSGHGLFERDFGEAYLLAYDSDPKEPYSTALSVSELSQALSRRVRSGRVLVIADAVRRDFFDPESDASSATLFGQAFDQLTASRPGVSAIIASGPGEFSREGQRWGGRGVFTKHLADVLFDGADRNGNVAVTTGELFELLKARVADDTSGKQHPWRSGSGLAHLGGARPQQPVQQPVQTRADRESAARTAPLNPASPLETGDEKKVSEAPAQAAPKPTPSQPPKQVAEIKLQRELPVEPKRTEKARANDEKAEPAQSVSEKKLEPPLRSVNEKKPEPPIASGETQSGKKSEINSPRVGREIANSNATPKPVAASSNDAPKPAQPAPTKPSPPRDSTPPKTETVRGTQAGPATAPPVELARSDVAVAEIAAAPKPPVTPPSTGAVSSDRAANRPETFSSSVPTIRPEAAPSPLVLQLETAIASKNLIEPKNASAWDFYQQMTSDPAAAADVARLKPLLSEALAVQGRAIVSGDVRGDNISDKVDDFKRAGQMLARARALAPDNRDVSALEKLSAAEALIALQFFDEAERALGQLQSTKLAAVENALGLALQGKLDTFRAERAFKRAIELDPKWAAPHYNLAMLYSSQQNQASLAEFESAASLDSGNVTLVSALGDEYFARQQWKQSAEAFRKAIALKPSDDNLHTKLGHALYSQGLQEEANREYQKARELRAKQP